MSNVLAFPVSARVLDQPCIDALRARDPDAVADVYRRHHAKVRGFARRMLNDATAAEDVVHDVFVELPNAIARFRGDAALDTFLVSIAVNLCRRRLRSSVRGRRAVERMQSRDVPVPVRTPEAEARRRQLADALTRGLETLTVEHREVIVLCSVEERTSREVAEILDVPEGTVRTRLMTARKHLRAFLSREGVR